MDLFEVTLGVDRAARDTGERMALTVVGEDTISAAIRAEGIADRLVRDRRVEYTHAMRVHQITGPLEAAAAFPVAA